MKNRNCVKVFSIIIIIIPTKKCCVTIKWDTTEQELALHATVAAVAAV